MKKAMVLITALVGCMFVLTGFAVNGSVGVLNFQQIMKTSPKVQQASEKLRKEFLPEQNKVVAQQDALKKLMSKLKQNAAVMRASDKAKLQAQIAKARQDLINSTRDYQQKVMVAQQTAMQEIIDAVKTATAKVAQQKGLDVVITNDAVIYAKDGLDITDQVQKILK